ncbi:hypothetical protein SLEP1_g7203 [Rubroshorea leprosula]|uniref:RBR-type E3 ubiquitin transferase n=1 Tax=Rubroshorea leprosula TaxID=152421 RepID=A0AAV5I283_9ROSI|nr:hypothetical protein SLEP1_g7203 [Rubroshorea leprosula]
MAGHSHESDQDYAFELQLQEALTASLAHHVSLHSPPATSTVVGPSPLKDTIFTLSAQHVSKSQQEALDHELLLIETQWTKEDRKRRTHEEKLARDIDRMPEHEWEEWGYDFERPFEEGSSKDVDSEDDGEFRMYFKGIVSHEVMNNETVALAGIGVAICDFRDNLIFEIKKPLTGDGLNKQAAELMALIEGLDAALSLKLKRIHFFCDYYPVFQLVTNRWQARQHKIAILVDQVWLLQRRFVYCEPILVPRYDIKYAFKLARGAILSQVNTPIESNHGKSVQETCVICLEETDMEHMFSVDGCLHRYCFSCIKQHVEVKLLHGMVPKCPHEHCKSELRVESCKKFLTPVMIETLKERTKEASIPATEKVYCPYPQCSALMSRSKISEYPKNVFVGYERSAARKCIKCRGLFCINCKVPWHGAMRCNEYKRLNPNPPAEDLKLKSLATRKMWRQCAKCNNMIEHSEGCWHMTCVCGYEFCYNCGAERKDKKATCSCPAWDVRRIWFENHRDSDDDD